MPSKLIKTEEITKCHLSARCPKQHLKIVTSRKLKSVTSATTLIVNSILNSIPKVQYVQFKKSGRQNQLEASSYSKYGSDTVIHPLLHIAINF